MGGIAMQEQFQALIESMRQALARIPETMRQEAVSRQVIIYLLARAVEEMGFMALPAWKPPRSTRDRIDLVAVDVGGELPKVEMAFAVDPLVELAKLKAMEWVDAPHKIVITFSDRPDKVQQSTFFLTKAHTHLNLHD
jgi:hypothetical protein